MASTLGLAKFFVEGNLVEILKMDEPIPLQIDGVLDLHTFRPRDVKDLVPDYLAACRERGILEVRIIHGKGVGNLRRTVHAILEKHPAVISFTLDHPQFGGWGATLVKLRAMEKTDVS
jgi:DNA-nicking Smr family endonuclease